MSTRLVVMVAVLLVAMVMSTSAGVYKKYPLFKQCDPRWGSDIMGGPNVTVDTICAQGCAMSSLSMALNGWGYTIPPHGDVVDPGTFNKWLRANHGYVCIDGDCCNLALAQPEKLSTSGNIRFVSEAEKPSAPELQRYIEEEHVVIAHVRNKTHFVLVTGFQGDDTFLVNDPAFEVASYTYGDISDLLLYFIKQAPGALTGGY